MAGLKRIKMFLPFEKIAQVNVIRGVFKADFELVNSGGSDNLVVRAVSKSDAEYAKQLKTRRLLKPVYL